MKNRAIIKALSAVTLFASLLAVFAGAVYAAGTECWFVRRNGNLQPRMSDRAALISKYAGYYIDEKHGDDNQEKVLYLTFDAGYENGNIEKILDTLRDESVPAAFFLLDNIIIKNTDLVKRMAEEGHLVCNHTKNHKDLTKCTRNEIEENVKALEDIYRSSTGLEMAKYFRFPEGKYSESALKCVSDMGYKTVFWSFAYADWDNNRQPDEDAAIKKIIENTHNGAVILLHPTSSTNAKILKTVIAKWREMGYSFGTLDDLTK